MRNMVRRYKKNIEIREVAQCIIEQVPGHKNWVGQIKALHAWVRDNVKYVKDVRGVETLATPIKTLQTRQGDCDDQSVLLASLLESIGHPTRFVAIGASRQGPFQHVFAETRIGQGPQSWHSLETTESFNVGHPMRYRKRMVMHN